MTKHLSCRKKRLLNCFYIRKYYWNLLPDKYQEILIKLELFADGLITNEEENSIRKQIEQQLFETGQPNNAWMYFLYYSCGHFLVQIPTTNDLELEIYNPSLEKISFSSDIVNLAEEVYYNQKEDSRLVLSDMLEDANYSAEIVSHLKSGFHPKGCWLIDQILRKE